MEDVKAVPAGSVSRVSWGSVFAGTVVALIVQITLIMLGLSIGFATIDPASAQGGLGGLGIGTAIWWILSSIIALFAGGWVSGRLAGLQRIFDGALHGIVTWGLVMLLSIYFVTSAVGTIIGSGFSMIGNILSASGQAVSEVLPQDVYQEIQQAARQNEQFAQELYAAVRDMLQGGATQQEREEVITLLTENTGMSRQEAEDFVNRVISLYQQAGPQLQQAAGEVAGALSQAAIWSFIMLILTGAAAAIGGALGRVEGPVKV